MHLRVHSVYLPKKLLGNKYLFWPGFHLSCVYMLMNGTKSNVTALTVNVTIAVFLDCQKNSSCQTAVYITALTIIKLISLEAQLSSNAHKHLRNCGRFINPSLQPQRCIYFRLVPVASDCRLAPDEMDFAWPVCQSAEAHILYWGWRMKTAQLSSAYFQRRVSNCLIAWGGGGGMWRVVIKPPLHLHPSPAACHHSYTCADSLPNCTKSVRLPQTNINVNISWFKSASAQR